MHYVCPACAGSLQQSPDAYRCGSCRRSFPILFGIPDFRLRSDRYLSLEDERAKAVRLHEAAANLNFDELVAYYYSITDDVPPELATRFAAYVRGAVDRSRGPLDALLGASHGRALLDAGCGSGGLIAAAAGRFDVTVGLDIALRWLVIARKRLDELGIAATLVCADVESPPLAAGSFSHVAAGDLLEHVYDPAGTVTALATLLEARGRLWLSASNRYCLGPHPLVRIWGVGYLPARLRGSLVRALRGVDSLRHSHLTSPREVVRLLREGGFDLESVGPRQVSGSVSQDYPLGDRILIGAYRAASRRRALRAALVAVGPAFEVIASNRSLEKGASP